MKKVSSRRRSSKKKTATPKKAVYPVKNWTVYDQALVQRGSLTVWLSEEAIEAGLIRDRLSAARNSSIRIWRLKPP
tara:strand:+ start:156 stop:383 length:228 start_codon:yes stop_codon:yes gene_type:complete